VAGLYQVVDAMRTPAVEWINPPFGEMGWQEIIPRLNMKMALAYWPWGVRDHPIPQTVLTADRLGTPPRMTLVQRVANVGIFRSTDPAREYATVTGPGGLTVCQAQGRSGELSVTCDVPADGTLKIQEYSLPGPWLSTAVPAGTHTIGFHYRPWDVPLGLGLCVLGLALTGYYIVDPRPETVARKVEPAGIPQPQPDPNQEFQI
jgi:hypothetical protein